NPPAKPAQEVKPPVVQNPPAVSKPDANIQLTQAVTPPAVPSGPPTPATLPDVAPPVTLPYDPALAARTPTPLPTPTPTLTPSPTPAPVAVVESPARQKARLLLAEVRQLRSAGDLVGARKKALEARETAQAGGVVFGPNEDSPEHALIDLSAACY